MSAPERSHPHFPQVPPWPWGEGGKQRDFGDESEKHAIDHWGRKAYEIRVENALSARSLAHVERTRYHDDDLCLPTAFDEAGTRTRVRREQRL